MTPADRAAIYEELAETVTGARNPPVGNCVGVSPLALSVRLLNAAKRLREAAPRDCPHGVQFTKRMDLCPHCMGAEPTAQEAVDAIVRRMANSPDLAQHVQLTWRHWVEADREQRRSAK